MRRRIPLAWRSLTHDPRRLILSVAALTFAAVLMFMQLGFLNAIFDGQVALLRHLDADLIMVSANKNRLAVPEPFSQRRIEQARAIPGVVAAEPVYLEGSASLWRNPADGRQFPIRAVGVRPESSVFRDTGFRTMLPRLAEPDTVLMDTRSKPVFGRSETGTVAELAGERVRVVGNFTLGADFDFDGTVVLGERTFLRLFPHQHTGDGTARIELGIIRVADPRNTDTIRQTLDRELPDDVRVWTKQGLIADETSFWVNFTAVGLVFGTGVVVGFVVGMVICSQILFTSVVDRMPLFGTLKAIGFTNAYLAGLVVREAILLSVIAFPPGVAISLVLYGYLVSLIRMDMMLTPGRVLLVFSLILAMSLASGLIAVRKAMSADPAEVFR